MAKLKSNFQENKNSINLFNSSNKLITKKSFIKTSNNF
ncbi:hypothetical protein PSOL_05420 [Candidatus Phytoplasma solani]